MHTPYRSRSHTQNQDSCKSRISTAERRSRDQRKKFKKLFPFYNTNHPYQHSIIQSQSIPVWKRLHEKSGTYG